MKRALVLTLVLGSSALLDAQIANTVQAQRVEQTPDVLRMSGGVTISTIENVQLKADEAEYNQRTGETALHGTVVLRQQLRPATRHNARNESCRRAVPGTQGSRHTDARRPGDGHRRIDRARRRSRVNA